MSYSPDELDDIEAYAQHAINDVRDLQDKMRANARRLGLHGAFLFAAADMLDAVVHDELSPSLVTVTAEREENGISAEFRRVQSDRRDYHSRVL